MAFYNFTTKQLLQATRIDGEPDNCQANGSTRYWLR